MQFKVRVSELRYGDVFVEARSEEEAKTLATGAEINFFDSEITDMIAERVGKTLKDGYSRELLSEPFIWEPEDWTPEEWAVLCKICNLPPEWTERIVLRASEVEYFVNFRKEAPSAGRTYIVTEVCPHCENEIEMRWDTDTMGFKAFCPVCGQRLMLCDECRHDEKSSPCDYNSKLDFCHHNPPMPAVSKPREVSAITLRVETPLGAIIARAATDPGHPGIYIDLRRTLADVDMPLALVEFSADDADYPEGDPHIITRVWGNAANEDYTLRAVHCGIEEYFKIEDGD